MTQIISEFNNLLRIHIDNYEIYKVDEIIKNSIIDGMNINEMYNFISNICATLISKEPDFNKLAVIYELKNIYEITQNNFTYCITKQYESNIISEKYYNFIMEFQELLIPMIDNSRDNLIDFFGLKTLVRSYLLKDNFKNIVETPQMMWLRCSIQIHGLHLNINKQNVIELIKQTYDLMSQLYFTHATPTLFNSGGRYPQLSSCYLLQCEDDLSGISKTISNIMMISKWAGGIGVNLSDIRANGALIKSNGGHSNGIIPLCKVLESVGRFINQCHGKDTIVYSKCGPITVENVKVNDELITKDGSYQKVLSVSTKDINKELLKIRVNHSFEASLVTNEHQIYAITDQAKILNYSVIKNRLDKKIIEPKFISASSLKEGDFMGFPIPTLINDVIENSDFFRLYGIILGDGHATKRKNSNTIEFGITLGIETKQDIYNFVINYLTNKEIHYWTNIQDTKHTVYIRWTQNKDKLKITFNDIYDENRNKIIKNEYLHLPKNKTLALLKGLLETDGHCDKEIYFNTSSRPLAFATRYLFLRIGILTSGNSRPCGDSHEIRPGEIITTKKDRYILRIPKHPELEQIYGNKIIYSTKMKFFEYNKILWTRIRSIDKENYNGIVYDFNMENNHNYLTDMGLVHNSGKRAGSIATYLEPWHTDIYEFIELRKNTGDENLRARDLFLALWIPNAFMRAVDKNEPWYLMTPDVCTGLTEAYGENFDELYKKYVSEGKYTKIINAKDLFVKIIECQIETGMPYMLYKDHVNEKTNQKNLGTIKSSNLCVAPETKVLTDKGYFEISSLKDEYVNVWNGEKFSNVKIVQTGKNQKLIKVNLSNGESIECTPYHKFYVYNNLPQSFTFSGERQMVAIEAQNLQNNMEIINYKLPIINIDNDIIIDTNPSKKQKISIDQKFDSSIIPINSSINDKILWFEHLFEESGSLINDEYFKIIRTFGESANVKIIKKKLIIKSNNYKFLKEVRLMLTTLSINPYIEIHQEIVPDCIGLQSLLDYSQYYYKLVISRFDLYILTTLGFKFGISEEEQETNNFNTKITIKNIIDDNRIDDTYCFNEPEKHMGIFNGIITGNCSEIVQMSSPGEIAVCNLASICLPKFVEEGIFNFSKLGEIVQIVVLNLNNIIDMNFYPVPETERSNMRHRPIGLGVQGLADTFIKMGYSFDSVEALKLNKQIFELIYFNALTKSNELAKEYGAYETFKGSPFSEGKLQFHLAGKSTEDMDKELNLPWDKLIESIKEFGTRNSLLTTIMPTASTAQIMNNTESIEPITTNLYVRKVLAGEYIVINKYLVNDLKEINMWNEQTYAELIYDNGSVQQLDIPEKLKQKYKTAYELKQKVIVDQSIDRSIFIDQSQSLNLFWEKPEMAKVYSSHMYGWKNGLKTGMYYLKSRPITEGIKFGIDINIEKIIKQKRGIENYNINDKKNNRIDDEVCINCSA
jgi:ribonucleoside-diphosphate reductase alpha chain